MRKLVVLLLSLALLAAACSGGGEIVATVNGTEITLSEVEALRVGTETVPREEFADLLNQLIIEEVVRQGAGELGLAEDQATVDAFYDEYVASIEAERPLEDFLSENAITVEALRHYAFRQTFFPEVQVRIVESAEPISEQAIQLAYEQIPKAAINQICTRHILVATEQEGQDVVDRLAAGEEFGELAAEVSTDPGSSANGGEIGCVSETDLTSGFDPAYAEAALNAPVGDVFGPFESGFGFHVLLVDSRQEQSIDELRDALEQQLSGTVVDDWYNAVMGAAEVIVTERYGTWQTEPFFGVVAPA